MLSDADRQLLMRARLLAQHLTVEDLAMMQPSRESTSYKKRGPGKLHLSKGGHAPIEYSAIEHLLDLRAALNRPYPNPEHVLELYLRLRALTGDFFGGRE